MNALNATSPRRAVRSIVGTMLLLVCTGVSACAPPFGVSTRASSASSNPAAVAGEITVFAASSLTDAFAELGERFMSANPGTVVSFNFGASTQLFTQLDQGARADVFAPADQVQMDRAGAAGRIDGAHRVFTTNRLVVITPAANPGQVRELTDLTRPGLKFVTSQEDVPVGIYTQAVFRKLSDDARFGADFGDRVNANIVSREPNVRQIASKVQLGEADAAIVYQTDVTPQMAPQLKTLEIPLAFNTFAEYPIARVTNGPNPAGAAAFITFVLSSTGQESLARWGFGPVAQP